MSPTACYDDSLASKRAVTCRSSRISQNTSPVISAPGFRCSAVSPPSCVCSMMSLLVIPQSTDNHWWKWIPGSKPRPGLAVVWRFDGDWYELRFLSSSRTLGEALVSHSIGHTRLSLVCGLLEFLVMQTDVHWMSTKGIPRDASCTGVLLYWWDSEPTNSLSW